MRLVSARDLEFLTSEVSVWLKDGLIDGAAADGILALYSVRRRSFAQALLCAGALLVGLGVICAVAANWDDIPRAARMSMIVAAYLGALAASRLCGAEYARTSRALLLLASLCFGGGIFLTAQMYHHGGHWSAAFGWWAFGLLPTAWLFCDLWQLLLAQGIAFWYLGGLRLLAWYDASARSPLGWYVLPGLLVLALWVLWLRLRRPMAALHLNILLSLGFVCSRLDEFWAFSDILLLLFAVGLALLAAFRRHTEISDVAEAWGTALCGLAGLALSVPELWTGSFALGMWGAQAQSLAAGAAVATGAVMALRLYHGSAAGGTFLALLAVRYFVDHFFGFMSKAASFSALGALCLFAGFVWERRMRRRRRRGEGRENG